ncbi:MAG: PQQ-binding-like beta-propeller repeat protein [Planctomycetes bacterium]|nr:PQQ-binding-like beta-propeller repeat protein [Planctomycetota bacterium]
MALKGDLDSLDLSQVFQMLGVSHKEGVLGVFGPGRPRALRFGAGVGVQIQFDPVLYEKRFVEGLIRRGELSTDQLQLVDVARNSSDLTVIDALTDLGLVDQATVDQAYRTSMEEEIYQLFFVTNAHFEFFEGRAMLEEAGGILDDRYCFHIDSIVMEAARRIDEWGRIREHIPDSGEVYVAIDLDAAAEADLSSEDFSLLELFDGWRSLDHLLALSSRPEFEIYKGTLSLLDLGCLRPLDPQQYSSAGVAALAEGRCAEAANLFERSAYHGLNLPEVLGAAARAREENGDFAIAASHYRNFADSLEAEERFGEAIQAYRDALELVPTDLTSTFRILCLTLPDTASKRSKEQSGAVARAKALSKNFLDAGDPSKARKVLELLVEVFPGDFEHRRALIACVANEGDQKSLIALYEDAAQQLIERKSNEEAIPYLQKILMIDRKRDDVRDRIKDLYKKEERRRSWKRGTVTLIMTVLLLVVVGVAYVFYEREASHALATIDLAAMREGKRFEAALEAIDSWQEKYPFAFVAGLEAKQQETQIESDRAKHEKSIADERDDRIEAYRLAVRRTEQVRKDGLSKVEQGEFAAGLARLEQAREIAPPSWPELETLASEIEQISTYLKEGKACLERGRGFENGGDLPRAREAYRLLLTQWGHSPSAKEVLIPVRIVTKPPGATVVVGEEEVEGQTPLTIRLRPETQIGMTIDRRGFVPVTIEPKLWTDDLTIALDRKPHFTLTLSGGVVVDPRITGDRAYVGLAGGRLIDVDLEQGVERYRYRLPDLGELFAPPLTDEKNVYFGDSNGRCVGWNMEARRELWSFDLGGSVRTRPALAGDHVVFASEDGHVAMRERRGGKSYRQWKSNAGLGSNVLWVGERIVVGTFEHELLVLDPKVPETVDRIELRSTAVDLRGVQDQTIVITGQDGSLTLFDLASRRTQWLIEGHGVTRARPLVAEWRIFYAPGNDLLEIDVRSGEILRRKALDSAVRGEPAVVRDRWLYFATEDARIVALGLRDFEVFWRWGRPGLKVDTMVSDGRRLLVGTSGSGQDSSLHVFEAKDEWQD